ncbi:MAG: hypothetical protein HZB87_01825 [Desulfatitalea sp.]|nr:hypothetical protein [Desulfatitalea sp.]MBI5896659.1 hypothetical protein [Desulfobacterales bacterium]
MKRSFWLLAMVLWIAVYMACGEDSPPPVETGTAASAPASVPAQAQDSVEAVILGTGEVTGAYYLIGEAIAAVVNKRPSAYKIHCTVESTGGSLFNVHAVMNGDLHFGLVHSQRNHEAAKGLGNWQTSGAQKELRSLFSLPFDPAPRAAALEDIDMAAVPSATGTPDDADMERFMGLTTLVTSAKVPEQTVYNFTKAVFENLSKLQDLHPAFAGATPQRMLQGLSAPIHPGALRYYREAGLK